MISAEVKRQAQRETKKKNITKSWYHQVEIGDTHKEKGAKTDIAL